MKVKDYLIVSLDGRDREDINRLKQILDYEGFKYDRSDKSKMFQIVIR